MKKTFLLIAAFVAALAVSSCSGSKTTSDSTSVSVTDTLVVDSTSGVE